MNGKEIWRLVCCILLITAVWFGGRAWASHRQLGDPDIADVGNCDEGNGVSIFNAFDEPHELGAPVLLEGGWYAVESTGLDISDTGAILQGLWGTLTVTPGLNDYTFSATTHFGTCERKFQITGVAVGDEFAIVGPCVATVDELVGYDFHLIEPASDPKTPEKEPFAVIANLGVFSVFKKSGGDFDLEKFNWDGLEDIPGGTFHTSERPVGAIKFLSTGTYKITFLWQMRAPPDGFGSAEIFTAEKFVNVVDEQVVEVSPRETGGEEEKELVFDFADLSIEPELTKVAYVVERLAGTGGHEADKHTPSPENDQWEIMEGDENDPVTHPTGRVVGDLVVERVDENKKTYIAGLFGGRERVRMIGVRENFPDAQTQKELKQALADHAAEVCQLGSVEIEVKVKPDLIQYTPKTAATGSIPVTYSTRDPSGVVTTHTITLSIPTPFWDLVDDPIGKHSENDGNKLEAQLVFQMFASSYGKRALDAGTSYSSLTIHRISTRSGGLYDIEGDWKKGHEAHNIGVEYDIDATPIDSDEESLMDDALADVGDFWMSKESVGSGEVWHVEF